MSKLLIIGNGFDLKLNVPSKFEDYFNNCLKKDNEMEIFFRKIKNYKLLNHSSNEQVYLQNLVDLKKDFSDLYKNSNVNLWFLILYNTLNYDYNKNWSDIESTLYSFLIENHTVNNLRNACNRVIFQKRYEGSNITDLEIYSYFLYFKYDELKNNNFNLYEVLMKELNCFEVSFSDYLSEVIKGKEYYKSANNLFSKLVNDDEFSVLNFNYTNPEKYNISSSLRYIENVHGSLKNKNIIIGIDYKDVKFESNMLVGMRV